MRATYFVLLGPPGAGKGTQAKRLAERLNLPHVSSGDIFREHMEEGTELADDAWDYIKRGELVPDPLTIKMMKARLSKPKFERGAIVDGFPRTMPQVEGLDQILADLGTSLDAVIHIKAPMDELVRRLTGRMVCRAEGHIYHRDFNPPQEPGVCDLDGSELYIREDDQEETVRNRIQVYKRQTAPLIEHYQERSVLLEVDGAQSVEEVTDQVVSMVRKRV